MKMGAAPHWLVSREKWWAAALGAGLCAGFIYLLFVRLLPIPLMQGELLKPFLN